MNKQNFVVGGVVVALVLSFLSFTKPGQVVVKEVQKFGGTSPDITSPYINVGGISSWFAQTQSLTQASTTLCALQSPAATSTLVIATLHMNVATTGGATNLVFAKSATAFATTTAITAMNTSVGSGAEANAVASSSMIFSPNQFLVVSQSGGSLNSTFSETGVCQAQWMQVSY